MSRRNRILRRTAIAIVGLASVVAGVWASTLLAPQRLRREVEQQLERATGAPSRVGSLRLEPGLPLELAGRDLSLWDGALSVERAKARVSLSAVLLGRVRLSRLELDGARLAIPEVDGAPAPPWGAPPSEYPSDEPGEEVADEPADPGHGLDRLLAVVQQATDALLGGTSLATALVVRDGRVEIAGVERPLVLADVRGELSTQRLRGTSRLVARTRVLAGDADVGLLEWQASGRADGSQRLSLTASDVDLGWLGDALGLDASGRLGGTADLRSPAPEVATLEIDWVASDVHVATRGASAPWWSAPRVAGELRVDADAARLRLAKSWIESGPLRVRLDASLARPTSRDAMLGVRARVASVDIAELQRAFAEMPAEHVEPARGAFEALTDGRIAKLDVRGAARWREWAGWLAGDADAPLGGLDLRARLDGLRVALGGDDAVEDLEGRVSWEGDRVALRDVRGRRGGVALPELDFALDGVSHLFASDLRERVPESDHVLLAGLPLVLELLEPEEGTPFRPPQLDISLDRLDHPTLLWPMRDVEIAVAHDGESLVGDVRRATWAGVPLRGRVEWSDEPANVEAHLVARAPRTGRAERGVAPLAAPADAWASGRVVVGAHETRTWAHERLSGRVWAVDSTVYADGIEGELAPSGRVEGTAQLGLGDARALPYRVEFVAEGLDAGALLRRAGLGEELVTGTVALRGELRANYREDRHPFADLSGRLDVEGRDGSVRHDVPAVLALTLAGDSLDFASKRENVRYTRSTASLELLDGVMQTDAFEFDGPDVRLFGSGSLDIGHPPHALDAEVAVFLFRPVDRVLGVIPVVGDLILFGGDNLIAAYFRLDGPWDAPTATAQPLRTLNTGPLKLVTGLPGVVRRGIEALGGALDPPEPAEPLPPPEPFAPNGDAQ